MIIFNNKKKNIKKFLGSFFETRISDTITNKFIDTGKIDNKYLVFVANKVKNNTELTMNEMVIFTSCVSEINEIIRTLV